jgi:hypothetical protein
MRSEEEYKRLLAKIISDPDSELTEDEIGQLGHLGRTTDEIKKKIVDEAFPERYDAGTALYFKAYGATSPEDMFDRFFSSDQAFMDFLELNEDLNIQSGIYFDESIIQIIGNPNINRFRQEKKNKKKPVISDDYDDFNF